MLHPDQLQQKKPKKRRTSLPYGYGSVHEIKDGKNRSKPWRARVPSHMVIDMDTGACKQKYINLGYYATKKEALDALADYRRDHYDYEAANITFEAVYNIWFKQLPSDLSESSYKGYQTAFRNSKPLHNMKMREIKAIHLERVMFSLQAGVATQKSLKNLWMQMYKYALKHELVQRNYATMISTKDKDTGTTRDAIPKEHREIFWREAEAGNLTAKIALIYIYTGLRARELLLIPKTDIDLENRMMRGGIKTSAGKDRRIPLHRCILPFIEEFMSKPGIYLITVGKGGVTKPVNYQQFATTHWRPFLQQHGMTYTMHYCRHTFATLAREANIDEDIRKLILGHSNTDITARYTHHPDYMLVEAIDKIPDRA